MSFNLKEYQKSYAKRRYAKTKMAGVCTRCKSPLPSNAMRLICDECAKKSSEYYRERKRKLKQAGICVNCQKRPAQDGQTLCEICGERHRADSLKRRQRLIEKGLCSKCGKNPPKPNERLCQPCRNLAKQRKWGGKHRETITRDDFTCQLCGSTKMLVVHHIDECGERHDDPNHDLSNLVTLCKGCHNLISRFRRLPRDKDLLIKLLLA